jgi:hypothetical protein
METKQRLNVRLKGLGFTLGTQMKLYGEEFEVASEPIIISEKLVLVDAIETKSGKLKRTPWPHPQTVGYVISMGWKEFSGSPRPTWTASYVNADEQKLGCVLGCVDRSTFFCPGKSLKLNGLGLV